MNNPEIMLLLDTKCVNNLVKRTIGGSNYMESLKFSYGIANMFFKNYRSDLQLFLQNTNSDDDDDSDGDNEQSVVERNKKIHYGLCFNKSYVFEYKDNQYVVYIEKMNDQPVKYCYNEYEFYYNTHIYTSLKNDSIEDTTANLKSLYNDCITYYETNYLNIISDETKLNKYTTTRGEYWSKSGTINKRYENTVYNPKKLLKDIWNTINIFVKNKIKYNKLNIPYKLNLMFKGEPGTGKTTSIKMIASKLNYDIRILNFTPQLTDDNFMDLVSNCKKNSVLVIEDIDCLFQSSKKNDENRNMISFSSLLNVLDGVSCCEGLIIIITTNNMELLEPKLIRSGRIDAIFTFEFIKKKEIEKMFINFCYIDEIINYDDYQENLKSEELTSEEKEDIIKPQQTSKPDRLAKFELFYVEFIRLSINISCSLLQGYLINYFDNPDKAIEDIYRLKEMHALHKTEDDKKLYS